MRLQQQQHLKFDFANKERRREKKITTAFAREKGREMNVIRSNRECVLGLAFFSSTHFSSFPSFYDLHNRFVMTLCY